MGTPASATWVTPLLQLLPAPLLRALDRWSHRRAVARHLERQQTWLRRHPPGNPATGIQKGKIRMARPITAEFQPSAFRDQPGFGGPSVVRGLNAAVALKALASIGAPFVSIAAKAGAVLQRQAEARKQRREDERLWNVALTDARVMADLSRAMSRDAARDVRTS